LWAKLSAIALVVVGLLAGILVLVTGGSSSMTFSAEFATAPGLFAGNQVRILGMPVGKITSVDPGPTYVTVVMSLPAGTNVPAGVHAYLMAPQLVNDRYVELDPAYTGGPKLADGAVIGQSHTATAISVDSIINSLAGLATALGPSGTNKHGALSSFLAAAAHSFGGNGQALHSTLNSLGRALGALSQKSPQLTELFDSLGNLSHVASRYTTTYQAFANDLAVVSTELASDGTSISAALHDLQQVLAALAGFIQTNKATLGASVANLDTFASAVAARQAQLAETYNDLPIALHNLSQAIDTSAPGGTALRARLDPESGSAGFSKSVCGSALLRLVLLSIDVHQDKVPAIDLGCGVNGLLAALPSPPGATTGPNLSLSALLGGQQ
jgi:virulence factor Mce-like protein